MSESHPYTRWEFLQDEALTCSYRYIFKRGFYMMLFLQFQLPFSTSEWLTLNTVRSIYWLEEGPETFWIENFEKFNPFQFNILLLFPLKKRYLKNGNIRRNNHRIFSTIRKICSILTMSKQKFITSKIANFQGAALLIKSFCRETRHSLYFWTVLI